MIGYDTQGGLEACVSLAICSQFLTRTFGSGDIIRQGSVSLNRAQGNHIILSIDYLVMCPSFSIHTQSKALRLQKRPSTSTLRPPSPKTCFKLRSILVLCAPAYCMVTSGKIAHILHSIQQRSFPGVSSRELGFVELAEEGSGHWILH